MVSAIEEGLGIVDRVRALLNLRRSGTKVVLYGDTAICGG